MYVFAYTFVYEREREHSRVCWRTVLCVGLYYLFGLTHGLLFVAAAATASPGSPWVSGESSVSTFSFSCGRAELTDIYIIHLSLMWFLVIRSQDLSLGEQAPFPAASSSEPLDRVCGERFYYPLASVEYERRVAEPPPEGSQALH